MRLPSPTVRPAATAACAITVAALGLTAAGCGAPETAAAGEPPIYVLNFHNAERGRADRRPADLVLSEFSTLTKVTWRTWGPSGATGAGKLSGTWCLPRCATAPYDATVTLSAVVPVRGNGYFTRYRVRARLPADERAQADLDGVLPTP
ncbi:hypothetical protein [Microbispora sp. ATCC PTA-5024]|uniref:hypothetical protein n=1 Tax=Microbispora sp. ATCC PTA-5024 TaxID=316330 RepID=UPI00042A83B3|nr:hypothetical protein [Microbispora sp. ATCC PTA-5024]